MRFEGAAWAAEFHIAPAPAGVPQCRLDGDGPGDRAILAVMSIHHALTRPRRPSTAGELATRALADGALLSEQTSLGPGISLATVALLHAGRLRQAQDAARRGRPRRAFPWCSTRLRGGINRAVTGRLWREE